MSIDSLIANPTILNYLQSSEHSYDTISLSGTLSFSTESGGSGTSNNSDVKITKIGNAVILSTGTITADLTGGNALYFIYSTPIPVLYRPSSDYYIAGIGINSTTNTILGGTIQISSAGVLKFAPFNEFAPNINGIIAQGVCYIKI